VANDLVERLARLDCCAVSDALDRLGLAGAVTGIAPMSVVARIAGKVHTVRLVAKDAAPPVSGPPRHLGTTAIEAAAPGEIVVIEQRSGLDAAAWGGILSLGAKRRGLAGVIADGPVRDIDEARTLGFPVYARSATARTARNRIVETETDGPVTIGEVTVRPGDYAIADSSGVALFPAAEAVRVIEAAEAIAAREAAMAAALGDGEPLTRVMGADYEHMLKR
jgi:4-hydroxy-4-methyl-2-oxoglutarate aldolase